MIDELGCYENTYDELAENICALFNDLQVPPEPYCEWMKECGLRKLEHQLKKIKKCNKQYTIFDL